MQISPVQSPTVALAMNLNAEMRQAWHFACLTALQNSITLIYIASHQFLIYYVFLLEAIAVESTW